MIQIEQLRKSIGKKSILDGIDLHVAKGETLALVGPSGTGKSVLLKHIAGILTPDAGDVIVDGESITRADWRQLRNIRKKIGYVFQGAALLEHMNVQENLLLALGDDTDHKTAERERDRIVDALSTVNLDPSVLNQYPEELSGGMRKRVGVARAIIHKPQVLLYDEPTTGLDPYNVSQVNELIRRAKEHTQATSIVITHDFGSVREVADHVALLYEGVVRFHGAVTEFFASGDPLVRSFSEPKQHP